MKTKFIAILQTGEAIESVKESYGDFDLWFKQAMDVDESRVKTYRVFEKSQLPHLENIAGIILTGSSAMVTEELEWSEAIIDWLKQFLPLNIPILGVCYGHQLLAKLMGGKVDWNPNGRQIGQVTMNLTSEATLDPLLSSLIPKKESSIKVIATHQQSVIHLPEKVLLLGSTALDPHHAFCYRNHIWGIQFHPEFNTKVIKGYINARADDLRNENLDPETLKSTIKPSNFGKRLLRKFAEICLPI